MRREIRNNVPNKIYLVYTFCGKALFAHLITELYMYDKIEHDCTTPKKLLLMNENYVLLSLRKYEDLDVSGLN